MSSPQPANALDAQAEDGLVLVDGQTGCTVTLTPEAALETVDLLVDAAIEAKRQRRCLLVS